MKKAVIGILMLLLLTGCWDRLPLRNLHLVDIAGLDLDEKTGDVVLNVAVTKLKSAGQGEGEPTTEMTELKGQSLVEAIGQGEYTDKGPFLGVNTRVFLMSKRFASQDPVSELTFLLDTPYTSINTPVVVYEGNMSKLLKTTSGNKKDFSKNLNEFILLLEKSSIAPNVSMMRLILSKDDPLEDIALPILKQTKNKMEFSGVLLFRQGKNTGHKLDKEQVRMMMLMLGRDIGRQRYTGHMSEKSEDRDINYGFSVKKGDSKITVKPESSGLPKVNIKVNLLINAFELGKGNQVIKSDYVNRMEKVLSKHLEENAAETIETLQKANSDVLRIGMQLKAYHPSIWKSLNWQKDYPHLSIEPSFDVKIINSEAE